MKRVLIVSPGFPPTSAADLHRVRTSLPHFAEFGWRPHVLAIDAEAHGGLIEPDLLRTLPPDVPVTRTSALPATLTRLAGIGNPGLRALGHLYAHGSRLLKREAFDLVYFSTTMFPVMALGRLWKRRYGVPFVVDIQDPWKTDYQGAGRRAGIKANAARLLHSVLEPYAMREVDGVVAVSRAYIDTLQRRYPWLADDRCAVIPFGASVADLDAARTIPWKNDFFDATDGRVHAVSVGRGGGDLRQAADLLFAAVRLIRDRGALAMPLHFWFIGTDYAAGGNHQTIAPAARAAGVGDMVSESPRRVPYLHALRLLNESRLTILLGSDDPGYSPSKIYPYLLARKPVVAVLHNDSPVTAIMRETGTGVVATFGTREDAAVAASRLAEGLSRLIADGVPAVQIDAGILAAQSARELTRQQCAIFDVAVRRQAVEAVPCAG